MPLNKLDPSKLNSWKELKAQFDKEEFLTIEKLMEERDRLKNFSVEWEGLFLDFTKNRISQSTLNLLIKLCHESDLKNNIECYFNGDVINETEKRSVLHTALRSQKNESEEIDKAVNLIRSYHDDLVLLHSTTSYPTNDEDINFNVIPTLENRYDCPVGYSGHEKGLGLTVSCVALGACVIERHFTLDRTMKGPDHASSIEREGMRLLVSRAKRLHIALGLPDIRILDCELPVRKKFRGY